MDQNHLNILLAPTTDAEPSQHAVAIGPTAKGMSVLSEMLQDEYQKRGGKPVVVDKGMSLVNEPREGTRCSHWCRNNLC